MTTEAKPVKLPGPDHPITVEPSNVHVQVKVAGRTVADSRNAVSLQEADYPAVLYLPRQDVDESLIERTDHTTYCPYKGDASYYSIPAGGQKSVNAIWTYESPHPAMAQIKDYVAFYPDRVDEITVS
jgi:uncharacterized protein (DUF427 family)